MRRAAVIFLLIFSACSKRNESAGQIRWSSADKSFTCQIPQGWGFEDQKDRVIPGFVMVKPDLAGSEPASLIRFSFYASGNNFFASPEEFAKKAAPGTKLRKEKLGRREVESAEISFQEAFPPNSAEPKLYDTRSRHVVMRDKSGFRVFSYTASGLRYAQNLAVFHALIEGCRAF